jgi:hypothetical protein
VPDELARASKSDSERRKQHTPGAKAPRILGLVRPKAKALGYLEAVRPKESKAKALGCQLGVPSAKVPVFRSPFGALSESDDEF